MKTMIKIKLLLFKTIGLVLFTSSISSGFIFHSSLNNKNLATKLTLSSLNTKDSDRNEIASPEAKKNFFRNWEACAVLIPMLLLTSPEVSFASNTAAQVAFNSIPPSTVELNLSDLPVVGKLLSGTYSKVASATNKSGSSGISKENASISISSPSDIIGAAQNLVQNGHAEVDVSGIIDTHLNIDVAANNPGVATIRVESPLIPKLPFTSKINNANGNGEKDSKFWEVTNMKSGRVFYTNSETGESFYRRPGNI